MHRQRAQKFGKVLLCGLFELCEQTDILITIVDTLPGAVYRLDEETQGAVIWCWSRSYENCRQNGECLCCCG